MSIEQPDMEAFGELIARREEAARKSAQSAAAPIRTEAAQVLSVISYATSDGPDTDQKQVNIPEGYAYFTHSVRETTGLNGRKITDWIVRDPGDASRIIEVHVKTEASHEWFHRCWVGAQLDVTIVPR